MDETRNKHGWIKLHAIIDVEFRIILTYDVTSSHTADIKGMDDMLKDLSDIDYSLERRDLSGQGNTCRGTCATNYLRLA